VNLLSFEIHTQEIRIKLKRAKHKNAFLYVLKSPQGPSYRVSITWDKVGILWYTDQEKDAPQ
ncbi:MAG: hypothetical protein MJA30_29860, partial [Cytophagales bacterium]|nr:hypothetical protein [Cytophagales bacterium]